MTKSKARKLKLNEVIKEYKKQLERAEKFQAESDLHKDLKGMKGLNDDDLEGLEKDLWAKLDKVKLERARRQILKEMGLPNQIIEQENVNKKEEANLEFSSKVDEDLGLYEKELREEENKTVQKVLLQGLETIEQELEMNRKAILNTKEIIIQETHEPKEVTMTGVSLRAVKSDKSEKIERDNYRSTSYSRTPAKKVQSYANYYSVGKQLSSANKKKEEKVLSVDNLPKLDLGTSITNFIVEPEQPKIVTQEIILTPLSAKKINLEEKVSPLKALGAENSTKKSQGRGRSEKKENKEAERKLDNQEDMFRHIKNHNNQNLDLSLDINLERDKENTNKPVPMSSKSKSPTRIQAFEERRTPKYKLNEKNSSGESTSSNYSSYKKDLSQLQSQLSKHLASLEKYFVKPAASAIRKARSDRSTRVSTTQVESVRAITDGLLTPGNINTGKEEMIMRNKKFEEEFELNEAEERDPKRARDGDYDPYYSQHTSGGEIKLLDNKEKFSLDVTRIEKDETMFSNSIFSIKEFDNIKEKDIEGGSVLKQLDNILGKTQHGHELGDCSDFQLNESRKRRKRADRLKKD